ncbi:MAG: hypothetical protein ABI675_19465 [Chitinophagaceae bacterium]
MFRPEDLDKLNADVKAWAKDTKDKAINELDALGVQASSQSKSPIPLRRALRTVVTRKDGITNRISFKIPRYAIFLHKGVGRGTKISEAGSGKRVAKQFLNPPIENNLDKLADIVADNHGTLIVNALTIR